MEERGLSACYISCRLPVWLANSVGKSLIAKSMAPRAACRLNLSNYIPIRPAKFKHSNLDLLQLVIWKLLLFKFQ